MNISTIKKELEQLNSPYIRDLMDGDSCAHIGESCGECGENCFKILDGENLTIFIEFRRDEGFEISYWNGIDDDLGQLWTFKPQGDFIDNMEIQIGVWENYNKIRFVCTPNPQDQRHNLYIDMEMKSETDLINFVKLILLLMKSQIGSFGDIIKTLGKK